MNAIRIIKPGLLTTIQDLGRFGYQRFGMPVCGAMDSYSLKLANWLVLNELNEACLEISFLGPEIEFLTDTIIGITGAEMGPKINGEYIPMNETKCVKTGDILSFAGLKKGARSYLSVSGGFTIPYVMGSKSTYLRGKIGGYKGRKLEEGDIINISGNDKKSINRIIPPHLLRNLSSKNTVRIIPGPEIKSFEKESVIEFINSSYTISIESDRMGYRLEGAELKHLKGADINSAGLSYGTIQVPGNGKPIIMLSDRQTVGGYTRLANIISVDIPLLGQMKPGDILNFKEISLDDAQDLFQLENLQVQNLVK